MRLELSTGCISDATSVAEKAAGNFGEEAEEAEARAEQGRRKGPNGWEPDGGGEGIGEQWGVTEDKENRVLVSTFTISSEV